MPIRTTHTLAILELPLPLVAFVQRKLEDAGYHHAIDIEDGRVTIDMTGIAIRTGSESMIPKVGGSFATEAEDDRAPVFKIDEDMMEIPVCANVKIENCKAVFIEDKGGFTLNEAGFLRGEPA